MGIIERRRQRRDRKYRDNINTVVTMMARFPDDEFTAVSLMQVTRLSSGRLYAALARLETEGRVTSRWSNTTIPRRRLYRLAEDGQGKVTV